MGLSGILDLSKTALLAAQFSMRTASHNIANASNPNYTRQRVILSAGVPITIGGNSVGTGVRATDIERVYDSFLGLQIVDANETMGRYDALEGALSRLEGIFNDSQGLGLGDALNDLFSSLQDVSNDPSSYSARTVLLSKARTLADRINDLDDRTRKEIENLDKQIKGRVDEINSISTRIASLNEKIQLSEAGGETANDLRDEREGLIRELSGKIDITVLEGGDGQVTILAAGGNSIVAGNSTTKLSVSKDPDNNNYYDVLLGSRNITDDISSGSLKGLLDARDVNFQDTLNRLETLAASITKEFNVIHRAGYGLDSSTGNDFFTALSPSVTAKSTNTGGAAATVSIQTLSSLTLDEYEIRFSSATTFSVVNATDGTVVSSGNSYTSGANIDFDGIRVVVTDGSTGPQPGDVFKVSVTDGAAQNFGVSLTAANKFAAAANSSGVPGDNTNVLSMINLEDTNVLSNSGATFSAYYSSLISDIGMASGEAAVNRGAQEIVLEELNRYRSSVSGVSLDEEATNLLKYQYAYEAAAKVITVVDSMMETIINLR